MPSMDVESTILCLQLQLDDVKEQLASHEDIKDRHDGNPGYNGQAALLLWQTELTRQLDTLTNRNVALALARETMAQHRALVDAMREETTARDDQLLARRLAGLSIETAATIRAASVIDETASVLSSSEVPNYDGLPELDLKTTIDSAKPTTPRLEQATIKIQHSPQDSENELQEGESSKKAGKRRVQSNMQRQCCCCSEWKHEFDTTAVPCSDVYCDDCVIALFESAIKDKELFPPRCHRMPIPIEQFRNLFSEDFLRTYSEKIEEYATSNPLYCSVKTCSAFIPPRLIEADVGTCAKCCATTCATCRDVAHEGILCSEDPHVQELRRLAEQMHWRECYRCNNVVELNTGCNHITYAIQPFPMPSC